MTWRAFVLCFGGLSLSAFGCQGERRSHSEHMADAHSHSADMGQRDALASEPKALFRALGTFDIRNDGKTDVIRVERSEAAETLSIRVTAHADEALCFQLESVIGDDDDVWVEAGGPNDYGPYCTRCTHRVWSSRRYGLFVFPNHGRPLPPGTRYQFQVARRDCDSQLPIEGPEANGSVTIEVAETATMTAERPRLPVAFVMVEGSRLFGGQPETDELLADAISSLRDIYEQAGITIDVVGFSQMPRERTEMLRFGPGQYAELDDLLTTARANLTVDVGHQDPFLVALTPCFARVDILGQSVRPEGHALRIPGGLTPPGFADGILVKDGHCGPDPGTPYWLSGEQFGRVIAHELGHALGLYHVQERDGQRDHLDDTALPNYMHHTPLSADALGWSDAQIHVMHHHPKLGVPVDGHHGDAP